MADRKISDLTALTTPASGDYLPIVDISEASAANKNKRITIEELLRGAPNGTAAAPGIAFESDPNTGIYSPGADQVAISTNGTGRLFVDADGEVGIGTGSPDGLLTLAGANSNVPRFRIQHPSNDKDAAISTYFDGSGTYLFVGSNHYVNSSGSNTKFDATSGSSAWYLDGSGIGIFYNSSGSGSITERLRIRADGTFEIKGGGTAGTSPAFSVNPSAPANSFVMLSDGKVGLGTSSPTSTNGGLDIASGGLSLIVGADGSLSTRTNATTKQARIGAYHYTNAEEPVGIATVFSTASQNAIYIGGGTSSVNAATSVEFYTAANTTTTTGTPRMIIDSSGNVGVGTSSPGATLHVEGLGNTVNQRIFTSDNVANATASLTFGTTPGSRSKAAIRMINSNTGNAAGDLSLLTDSGSSGLVSRLYINAAGNVGVGTTSPQTLLHLASGVGVAAYATFSGNNGSPDPFIIGQDASGLTRLFQTAAQPISFWTNSTERARIDSSGTFRVKGAGTAGVNDAVQLNGSAPANSLLLDASGRLLVGTSSASGGLSSSLLQVQATGGTAAVNITRTTGASGGYLSFNQGSSGNDVTTGTLGRINWYGYHTSAYVEVASIKVDQDGGTPSATSMPGRLVFSTTADGASSPTERMRITSAGNVAINSGTGAGLVATQTGFSVIGGADVSDATPGIITLGSNDNGVSANDVLGRIRFHSNDASTSLAGTVARIECIATGAFSGTAPTALAFFTNNGIAGAETEKMRIKANGTINFSNVAVYADNTAALAGGLVAGDVYRKSDGTLMITY